MSTEIIKHCDVCGEQMGNGENNGNVDISYTVPENNTIRHIGKDICSVCAGKIGKCISEIKTIK